LKKPNYVAKEQYNAQVKKFTLKEFEDIFRAVELLKQKIMVADPNLNQSLQIHEMSIKHSPSTSICMKI
jgi:hypothetical protein